MIGALSLVYVDTTTPTTSPPRADITIACGESARIALTVLDSAGSAVDLTAKTIVYAASKRAGATPTIYRECPATSEIDGEAELVLASSDTADLASGSMVGRFWLLDDSGTKTPISAVSTLRLTEAIADLDATPTTAPGEATTLTVRGSATFTAASTVTVTYAGGATFAAAQVPTVGAPYVSDGDGTVTVEVTAYTTTGFTLTASAEFTGSVPYVVTGAAA